MKGEEAVQCMAHNAVVLCSSDALQVAMLPIGGSLDEMHESHGKGLRCFSTHVGPDGFLEKTDCSASSAILKTQAPAKQPW